jgi:hypothetical protein
MLAYADLSNEEALDLEHKLLFSIPRMVPVYYWLYADNAAHHLYSMSISTHI